MTSMSKWACGFIACVVTSVTPLYAQHTDHEGGHASGAAIGHVSFPNSGSSSAQNALRTGLAYLHSFEYDQAADSFRAAEQADPRFALPYWMEAFTNSKLVWGIEDKAAALAPLQRLGPTAEARLALARMPAEKAFGEAIETFYRDGPVEARAKAFSEGVQKWAKQMPADQEAHAFAALGLILEAYFVEGKTADSLNAESVRHGQFVFDRNPQHPGAAHYIIHASDNPAGAQRGLKAARAYSRIAPDAEHALHMPSHIFLPLGLWDDMVQSNERAWRASRTYVAKQNRPVWENDWHSLNWLQSAYLQLGRWKDARALIDTARALTSPAKGKVKAADDPDAMYAVEQLAFRYASETGDWSVFPSDSIELSLGDSAISERAQGMGGSSLYQRTVAAALRGDTARVNASIATIQKIRPQLAEVVNSLVAAQRHDTASMISILEKVWPRTRVDRFSTMVPNQGLIPGEMLAGALASAGRPREAIGIYRAVLEDRPRRAVSMLGLARAQEAAGDKAGSKQTYDELRRMWKNADPAVRALIDRR
ncbi:MAG TPA: bacterial transcriptional activator domain-containing protein [Gemmatimonadaceae bacterium]